MTKRHTTSYIGLLDGRRFEGLYDPFYLKILHNESSILLFPFRVLRLLSYRRELHPCPNLFQTSNVDFKSLMCLRSLRKFRSVMSCNRNPEFYDVGPTLLSHLC